MGLSMAMLPLGPRLRLEDIFMLPVWSMMLPLPLPPSAAAKPKGPCRYRCSPPGSDGLTWMSMWRRPSTAWGVRGGAEASARIALFTLQCGSKRRQQMVVAHVAAGCQ